MPDIQVPSIWDYIAQAGQQGINSYQDARRHVEEQAAQAAGLMTQLFGAGAVDSSQLESTLGKVPSLPKGIKVQPNKAELARKITADPNGTYTDDQRRAAGLPTSAELATEKATKATAEQTSQVADIAKRWMSGQPISEQEALIAKLPSKEEFALMKQAKADPTLEQAGTQYVDSEVLKLGGKINPAQAAQIASKAYQQYVTDYQKSGAATLTTAQLQNAQRFFSGRVMELLIQQRRDETARISAERDRSSIPPQDRMFAQLTGLLNNNRATMSDFMKNNAGVEMMSSKYANNESAIPPAFKGAVKRYQALKQRETDLQRAQSQLAAGIVPSDFANLLSTDAEGGAPQSDIQNRIPQIKADFKAGKLTRKQVQDSKLINDAQKAEILGTAGGVNLGKKQ